MIGKNYKPALKPRVTKDGSIQISDKFWNSIRPNLSGPDLHIIHSSEVGRAVCPPLVWLEDSPEVRRILGMEPKVP